MVRDYHQVRGSLIERDGTPPRGLRNVPRSSETLGAQCVGDQLGKSPTTRTATPTATLPATPTEMVWAASLEAISIDAAHREAV